MPKYTIVLDKKIVGYDDDTDKIMIYEPKEAKLSSLTDEEQKEFLKGVSKTPGGGIYVLPSHKKSA
jgi:hypothetical protein